MKYFCILTLILIFFSCQKNELIDLGENIQVDQQSLSTHIPDEILSSLESLPATEEKNLFTTYPIIQNTNLLSHGWTSTENFQTYFIGEWKTIEVIAVDIQNQIIHLDYTALDIKYNFTDICKSSSYNQFHCKYQSTNIADPAGHYQVYSHIGQEYLYVLPNEIPAGEPATLKERPWGEILLWPGRRDIMVVHWDDPNYPYWLIFQKSVNG